MRLDRSTKTLLRGLLLPDEPAATHLDGWCRSTDLDLVDPATHRLLPLLYRRLADLGMSPPEFNRLRGVYRKTWYRNQRHLEAVKRAADVLIEAQIELTLVRGLALALGPYRELGLRMMDAARVVVEPERITTSIDLLTNAGFAVDGRVGLPGYGLPTILVHQSGGRIDIREFVYGPGWSGKLEEPVGNHRISLPHDGLQVGTLAPSDSIAVATAFGLSVPMSQYQCLIDLAMLTRQADPADEWTDLINDYQDTPLAVPIGEAFGVFADEIPGALTSAARELTDKMRPTRRQHLEFWSHRRGRRFARLPAWYRRAARKTQDDERVGFVRFAKSVYNVDTTRDVFAKTLRRIRNSSDPPAL